MTSIDSYLSKVLANAFNHEYPSGAELRDEFRVSGMPYCPILRAFDVAGGEGETRAFEADFYFGAGNSIHANLQHHLPLIKKYGRDVFGDWECESCGKKWSWCKNPSRSKAKCCENHKVAYREVEISYTHNGVTISGHIDLMLWPEEFGLIVLDFKSMGNKYYEQPHYTKYLPFAKNVAQIEMYCLLLNLAKSLKVKAYSLVYIGRDWPSKMQKKKFKYPHVIRTKVWTPKREKQLLEYLHRVMDGRAGQAKLKKINNSEVKAKAAIDIIVANRPCQRYSDYHINMDAAFFGAEKCPNLELCCGDKSGLKDIKKQLFKAWKAS